MNSITRPRSSAARTLRVLLSLAIVSCYGDQSGSQDPQSNSPVDDVETVRRAVTTDPITLLAGTLVATGTDVGKTAGAFAVTKDGQSTYTIPIWVAPGLAGMEPKISLSYNSAGGDGYLGTGWSLTGLSQITRCARTHAQDHMPQAVRFEEVSLTGQRPDAFCLDGMRLVKVSGSYAKAGSEYRTQPETFARVRIEESDSAGPTLITVRYKDGRIGYFGGTTADWAGGANAWIRGMRVIYHPGDPNPDFGSAADRYGWLLSRLEDRAGNSLQVTYQQNTGRDANGNQETLPSVIRYTGSKGVGGARAVKLAYIDRPWFETKRYRSVAGLPLQQTKLLDHIDIEAPDPQTPAVVRRYRFGYFADKGAHRAMLSNVQECDGDPSVSRPGRGVACKSSTDFKWKAGPQGFTDLPQVGWNGNYTGYEKFWGIQVADLDNDGRDDILYRLGYRWYYRLARPDGNGGIAFASPARINIAEELLSTNDPTDLVLVDRDSDGFVDILSIVNGECRLFKGSGTTFAREATNCDGSPTKAAVVGDFDGNGLADLARPASSGGSNQWRMAFQSSPGQMTPAQTFSGLSWDIGSAAGWNAYAVDTDGDGKLEILGLPPVITPPAFLVRLGKVTDGTGNDWTSPGTTLPISEVTGKTRRYFFADFSGDGLSDVLSLVEGDSAPSVGFNDGRSFSWGTVQSALSGTAYNIRIGHRWDDSNDPGIRFMDYNMDGRQDILLVDNGAARDTAQATTAARTKMAVLLSRGFSGNDYFVPVDLNIPVGDPADGIDALGGAVHNYKTTQLLDANGDGLTDIVQVVGGVLHLYLRVGEAPYLLASVTDGMGEKTSVAYKPLVDPTVYTPFASCSFPQICVKRGPWVVSEYQRDSAAGRDTHVYQLSYADGRVDTQGHGWLGFLRRTTYEPARKTTTIESFDNHTRIQPFIDDRSVYPYLGLEYSSVVQTDLSVAGVSATRTIHKTQTYDYVMATDSIGLQLGVYPRLKSVSQDDTDPTPSSHRRVDTVLTYVAGEEDFGNLASQTITTTLAGGATQIDMTTWSSYVNDRTSWIVGLPTYVATASQVRGEIQRRVVTYSWASQTGLLQDEYLTGGPQDNNVPLDPDVYLHTQYLRNPRGQITDVIKTALNGESRRVGITYDPVDGTFPFTKTNSLGQVTTIYTYPALGVTRAVQRPNGARAEWQYDGFGRQRAEAWPGGGGGATSYAKVIEPGLPDGKYLLQSTIDRVGGGQTIVTHNRLGQEIERRIKNLDGTFSYTKISHDVAGRRTGVTKPTAVGLAPDAETTFGYDNLDRVVSVRRPDEGATSTGGIATSTAVYTGFYQAAYTDEVGRTSQEIEDELGRPQKTIRKGPSGDISAEFAYGPFGVLETVLRKNAAGSKTTTTAMGYDRLGRRTILVDPDAGRRTFAYTPFGEVREETDATPATATYGFDKVGRLVTKVDKDGTTSFAWDTATNGLGLLASATSPDGVKATYGYDGFGRPINQSWAIAGATYDVSQTFDASGRRSTLTYPAAPDGTRLVVRNSYDADSGELSQVLNDSTGAAYWTAVTRNGARQLTRESFGNGEETVRQYFARTGRLQRIDTSKTQGGVATYLQKLGYDYYANGSVRLQSDDVLGQRWGYDYDQLDRVSKWYTTDSAGNRLGGSWEVKWDYDDFGNLTGRTYSPGTTGLAAQALTFDYAMVRNAGPHAVTHSAWGDYGYDQRGNQIARPGGETVTYTAFDLPRQITGPTAVSFKYTAFGQRALKQLSAAKQTVYVGGLFEKRIDGTSSELVHHIAGAERTIAEVSRYYVGASRTSENAYYLHADNLESVDAITNQVGALANRVKRDPFGNRVTDFSRPVLGTAAQVTLPGTSGLTKGFTEHEEDGDLGLINMRGRIYDPRLGRFMTTDPVVQFPFEGDSYNRYAYVFNNPLKYTDPSGFDASCPGWQFSGPEYSCDAGVPVSYYGTHDGVVAQANAYRNSVPGIQIFTVEGVKECDSEGDNCHYVDGAWTVTFYNVKKEEVAQPASPQGGTAGTGQAVMGNTTTFNAAPRSAPLSGIALRAPGWFKLLTLVPWAYQVGLMRRDVDDAAAAKEAAAERAAAAAQVTTYIEGPAPLMSEDSRQKGDRMKDGTAEEADEQLEELEDAQARSRAGKGKQIIDDTEKSRQRSNQRRRRIRSSNDVPDEYPED